MLLSNQATYQEISLPVHISDANKPINRFDISLDQNPEIQTPSDLESIIKHKKSDED